MYTPLEKGRLYQLGDRVVRYIGRDFPEESPPRFEFQDLRTGEIVDFLIEQLSALEEAGQLKAGRRTLDGI